MDTEFHYAPPTDPWLKIIHEDRDMVVVDKPSGLLSVPGRIHTDSVTRRVEGNYGKAYPVHRLDMDTSGLMIIAIRRKAEKELHRQFRERLVEKRYAATVWGCIREDEGKIDLPLIRLQGLPPRSKVDHDKGREALTRFEVLERQSDRTRIRLFPKTGRSHQLRIHMAAIGHPIIGDRFYGNRTPKGRLLLHAEFLRILHPFTGAELLLESTSPF